MPASKKPLGQQAIVITGATSGIGLATAKIAAARGASLVLVARGADVLNAVSATMAADVREVLCVPTDVADSAEVA